MPIWDMTEPPEWPEPQNVCGSCWYYDEIENSRFEVVMYCHYHEEAYEDYEICDEYENAAVVERIKRNWEMKRKQEEQ